MAELSLLDPAVYSDPATFQAERRVIFGTGWQVVGPAAAFAFEGAYVALGLGGWSLFVIRCSDGHIRAFRNVCAHQKLPVLENGRGRCNTLRCRYHGWTYDAEGRLVAAPASAAPDGGDLSAHRLEELPSAIAGALVFARLNPLIAAPTTPDEELVAAGLAVPLGDLDTLGWAGAETRPITPNWKAVVDVIRGERAGASPSIDGQFTWVEPTTGIWREPDGTILLHIVPRTFRKTELHLHLLAVTEEAPDVLRDRARSWADRVMEAALRWQSERATGENPDPDMAAHLAPFHTRINDLLRRESTP